MALARIDSKAVAILVATQFQLVTQASLYFFGEPVPDAVAQYARLMSIDVNSTGRVTTPDQSDFAELAITVQIAASPATVRTDAYALEAIASDVSARLSDQDLSDGARHKVHLDQSELTIDRDPDPVTRFRTGAVVITGVVERSALPPGGGGGGGGKDSLIIIGGSP